jgi:chitinase
MLRKSCPFTESDVRRAIEAIQAMGLNVVGVVIGKDGAIEVRVGKEKRESRAFSG